MKSLFYRVFFVQVFLSCSSAFSQTHKLDSVKLEFAGFDTETVVDVTCDAFDGTFLKTRKVKIIHQKQTLLQLQSLRKNFEHAVNRSFDVRGKVSYFYGVKAVKYCFDVFGYFYINGKLYHNKGLLIAIAENLYAQHPKYLDTLSYHE